MSFLHFLRYIAVVAFAGSLARDSIQLRRAAISKGNSSEAHHGHRIMTHQTVEYFPTSDVLALMFDTTTQAWASYSRTRWTRILEIRFAAFPEELAPRKANASVCTAT